MNIKHLLAALLCALSVHASAAAPAEPTARPNILFILADDQSWETLGHVGGEVQTPNLDRLAARGSSFTHSYNMGGWDGALCTASRAMFLSGRSLWHNFVQDRALRSRARTRPPPVIDTGTTWSQWLAAQGYHTYFTGKWHTILYEAELVFNEVGTIRPGMPSQRTAGYNRPQSPDDTDWLPWDKSQGGFWAGGTHWSEVLRDEAVAYLQKAADTPGPFFAHLAFNAPHDPRQSPKEYVDRYPLDTINLPTNFLPEYPDGKAIGSGRGLRDERLAPFPRTEHAIRVNRQEYYALITHMDDQIGLILDALEQTGQADNTFIFFTADHGLSVGHHGLMGKQNMYEHSLRAPLIVAGPGVPQGKRFDQRVYIQDIVPTSLEMAGVPVPPQVEFKSFLPLLMGENYEGHQAIYGAYMDHQRAVIEGDWKLIFYPDIPKHLLFNVANDLDEVNNLAHDPQHADRLVEMKAALDREMGRYKDIQLTEQGHYKRTRAARKRKEQAKEAAE